MPFGSIAFLLAQISVMAGGPILEILRRGFSAGRKADASPVTEADLAAENLIVELLGTQLPGVPIVAEELVAAARAPVIGDRFILVDPLDGTREFMAHRSEFTVNLALIENGRPVAGAIYAPLLEQLWFADTEKSYGANCTGVAPHHGGREPPDHRAAAAFGRPRSPRQPFSPRPSDRDLPERPASR